MSVIEFKNVFEKYRIKFIKEGKVAWEEILALEDINFKIDKGEVLGIIGQNGAGKTTFLRLITGMLIPDQGNVDIKGKVSALMELGAGFNPEFTGRENISLNARMYGLNEQVLKNQLEKIINFAGLGRFIDAPIKCYSQGMYMRLAFALAIHIDPDIFLIDDILAVGDEEAKKKCIKEVFELKQAGKTIIVVSHDLEMIRKLCDRVILLEKGKIVKEGLPAQVIPYYLETVGNKNGIAILEKEKLRIVFNNGRILASYDGFPLTRGTGGYVSFFMPALNFDSSSFHLDWNVERSSSQVIIAKGAKQDGAISQIWTIQIQENQLEWHVEIKDSAIKDAHIYLLLMPEYRRWINLEKEGDFPSFAHKTNWQDLGLTSFPEALLGISTNNVETCLPCLLFECNDKNAQIKLFNSGYEEEARVIKAYLNGNSISVDLKIFHSRAEFANRLNGFIREFNLKQQEEQALLLAKQEEEEALLLAKQKEEEASLIASRSIKSGELRLFADVETKSLRLYFKDKEITKAGGLHSSFTISQQWFDLRDAQWQTRKDSEKELILIIDCPFLSLSQIWKMIFKDENTLTIKIEMELNKPTLMANFEAKLELQDQYQHWLTAYEQGDFLVKSYVNNIAPIRLRYNKVSKVILRSMNEKSFSQLFFSVDSDPDKHILDIYKRKDLQDETVCLNFSLIIPSKEMPLLPGKKVCFEGDIVLNKDIKLEESTSDKIIELKKDSLQFVFDKGKGRIFWHQKELTAGLSVYTSVRSLGFWYDSYQANWDVSRKGNNAITALGYWPHIPISQTWHIELIDKDIIRWVVEMQVYKEIHLEILQANLMLCPRYRSWIVSDAIRGQFLDEYTEDYDILPFRFWYGRPEKDGIAAVDEEFPKISFSCGLQDNSFTGIVENTDFLYKARLIQYQKSNKTNLSIGKYLYFEGAIKLESE